MPQSKPLPARERLKDHIFVSVDIGVVNVGIGFVQGAEVSAAYRQFPKAKTRLEILQASSFDMPEWIGSIVWNTACTLDPKAPINPSGLHFIVENFHWQGKAAKGTAEFMNRLLAATYANVCTDQFKRMMHPFNVYPPVDNQRWEEDIGTKGIKGFARKGFILAAAGIQEEQPWNAHQYDAVGQACWLRNEVHRLAEVTPDLADIPAQLRVTLGKRKRRR